MTELAHVEYQRSISVNIVHKRDFLQKGSLVIQQPQEGLAILNSFVQTAPFFAKLHNKNAGPSSDHDSFPRKTLLNGTIYTQLRWTEELVMQGKTRHRARDSNKPI